MKTLILTISLLLANQAQAIDLTIHDFKDTPDAPISKQLVDRAIKTMDMSEDCKPEHFSSGIRGNMRAIWSAEDACDGGNASGIVIDISTMKTVFVIMDSDLEVVK